MKRLTTMGCALALAGGCADDSRRNYAPQFEQATVAAAVTENATGAVASGLTATDRNGAMLSYSLAGSDAALFTFAAGALQFASAPDFEAPADADGDNVYEVEVIAADPQGLTARVGVSVSVENANEAPSLALPAASFNIDENNGTGLITSAMASDPDGDALSFSLGGADAALFDLSAQGVLTPLVSFDFEAPQDADTDNRYALTVSVSDGEFEASEELLVAVADLDGFARADLIATNQPRMFDVSWALNDATPPGDHIEVMLDLVGDGNFVLAGTALLTDTMLRLELPLIDQTPTPTTDLQVEVMDAQGAALTSSNPMSLATVASANDLIGYVKANVPSSNSRFGWSSAISADGNTVVIGAPHDASDPVLGEADNSLSESGAIHVFNKGSNGWQRTGFLKASNAQISDEFGAAVAINQDGTIIVVGAPFEDGVDDTLTNYGAAYVYVLDQGVWMENGVLRFDGNSSGTYGFGRAVAISDDGATIAVGAPTEDQSAGAVYTFEALGGGWSRNQRLEAPAVEGGDLFGNALALDASGSRLLIAARGHDTDSQPTPDFQGTVYAYARNPAAQLVLGYGPIAERVAAPPSEWLFVNQIDAPNAERRDFYGTDIDISADGSTAIIGAIGEDSLPGGGPLSADNSQSSSGAAYIARFDADLGLWTVTALIKPTMAEADDGWGFQVAIDGIGSRVAVTAGFESGIEIGIGADLTVNGAEESGAAALYDFDGSNWVQTRLVKAPNPDEEDTFGQAMDLANDGATLVIGAPYESSATAGINAGIDADNSLNNSGAVYVY